MVNYCVARLHALLRQLWAERCLVLDEIEGSEYSKLGWVLDPEGNKTELWEPREGQSSDHPGGRLGKRSRSSASSMSDSVVV